MDKIEEPEMSQPHKVKSMDPRKFAFVQKYLEDVQDSRSMTTEVSDSGLATHTAASELGTEEINGKLVMLFYCCGASVASEQQHKQDLKRICRRGYEFSNSSLFTRVHCATFYQSALHHEEFEDVTTDVTLHVTPPSRRAFSRGF